MEEEDGEDKRGAEKWELQGEWGDKQRARWANSGSIRKPVLHAESKHASKELSLLSLSLFSSVFPPFSALRGRTAATPELPSFRGRVLCREHRGEGKEGVVLPHL